MRDQYLELAAEAIGRRDTKQLLLLLQSAADEFNAACMDCDAPKIGVVGEIFLKFNPFAQKNLIDWLIEKGVEVVPPILSNFFMQSFVNRKVNVEAHVENRQLSDLVLNGGYRIARKQINKINAIAARFRYFVPFGDIFEEAEETKKLVSLHAQFGEGWLLPAEIVAFAREGVNNVVSLQPFGCIANHIVAKGIEKRVRNFYPDINFLSLDFDSGVSEVNIVNRMLLFMDNLKK